MSTKVLQNWIKDTAYPLYGITFFFGIIVIIIDLKNKKPQKFVLTMASLMVVSSFASIMEYIFFNHDKKV